MLLKKNTKRRHLPTQLRLGISTAYFNYCALVLRSTRVQSRLIDMDSSGRFMTDLPHFEGNVMKTTLMSDEERRLMWNLAFFFTIKHGGATAFRSFTTIRSFITYHGIFMGPGYDRGEKSVWRKTSETPVEEDSE